MDKGMIAPVLIIIVVFSLVGLFGWWMYRWQYTKADDLLDNWARSNHYQVLKKEKANPGGTGPGVRYAENTQVIYRIEVLDAAGQIKTALIKIGGETAGTLSDAIEVVWD
jgi:hypothetical protein